MRTVVRLRGAEERRLREERRGLRRFSSRRELAARAWVYAALCPLLNYFIPLQKLLSKTRIGAKVKKVYDKDILSPCQRLMASEDVPGDVKAELARRLALYGPVVLRREVHDAVAALTGFGRE